MYGEINTFYTSRFPVTNFKLNTNIISKIITVRPLNSKIPRLFILSGITTKCLLKFVSNMLLLLKSLSGKYSNNCILELNKRTTYNNRYYCEFLILPHPLILFRWNSTNSARLIKISVCVFSAQFVLDIYSIVFQNNNNSNDGSYWFISLDLGGKLSWLEYSTIVDRVNALGWSRLLYYRVTVYRQYRNGCCAISFHFVSRKTGKSRTSVRNWRIKEQQQYTPTLPSSAILHDRITRPPAYHFFSSCLKSRYSKRDAAVYTEIRFDRS